MHRPLDSLLTSAIRIQPDARLARLAAEGESRAFDELDHRYRSHLVRFAAGIVGPDEAEDVAQEALLKASESLRSGAQIEQVRAWLYAIARNRALDVRRTRRDWAPLDERIDGVPQPPAIAAMRQEVADVVGGLKRLPRAQREALVKRELEGRSLDEIATDLDVSPGAARGLVYRARESLRNGLGLLVPLPALRLLLSRAAPSSSGGIASGSGGIGASAGVFGAGKVVAGILTASAVLAGGAALHGTGRSSASDAEAAAGVPVRTDAPAGVHAHGASGDARIAERAAGPSGRRRSPGARAKTGSSHSPDRASGGQSGPAVGGAPPGSDEVSSSEGDLGDGNSGTIAEPGDGQGADSDSSSAGDDGDAPAPAAADDGDAQGSSPAGDGSSDSGGDQIGDSGSNGTDQQAEEPPADAADSQR